MKKIVFLLGSLFTFMQISAQNVGIGTSAPAASAKLEVNDTAKGILIPRMDALQRVNIIAPARGLMVYETSSDAFWYFNGSSWLKVGGTSFIADADGNTNIKTEKNPDENIIRFSLNGPERWLMKNAVLEPVNPSNSIYIGTGAGMADDLSVSRANIAIGRMALFNNTTGGKLVAIGDSALYSQVLDSTGTYSSTAIGSGSLYSNTIGHSNTATGTQSLYSNVSGKFNVANGKQALYNNIDGVDNTAIGHQALFYNSSGSFNTATGDWCLRINTTGILNTAAGVQALHGNNSGSQNTAQGALALTNNTSGNFNTAMGYFAGLTNTTGNNNTLIGSLADLIGNNLNNAGAIGYNAKVAQSNSFVIGGTGADAVNVGIGTTAPTERLEVIGNIKATGTITPSDARFKKDIQAIPGALDKLLAVNAVAYNWKLEEFPGRGFDKRQQLGFIAQDIEKLFPQIVYTASDGYKGVDYSKLVPVLVAAIQEQNADNQQLRQRLENLEKLFKNTNF